MSCATVSFVACFGLAPDDPGARVDAGSDANGMVDAGRGSDASDSAAPAFPATWSVLYASALDVGVGTTDDDIWVLDYTLMDDAGNYEALHWNADTESFQPTAIWGWLSIDVTSVGPCVVKQDDSVWVSQPSANPWGALTQLDGGNGLAIGAAPSAVWVIGVTNQPGEGPNQEAYRWTGQFSPDPLVRDSLAYGMFLDVAPDGSAWIIIGGGEAILHATLAEDGGFTAPQKVPLDGTAFDIGVGADGSVYAVGVETDGTRELFKYSPSAARFEPLLPIAGVKVSAGPSRVVVRLEDGRLVRSP